MRISLMILPLAAFATPAFAQGQPAPAPRAETIAIPPQLTDPRFTDRLVDVMQVLTKSLLDTPVGEVQAALEGRKPTSADKRRTVRTETRMSERQLQEQIERSRPMMQASMKAMATALPAMMKGMGEAAREMEKATSNLPQPGYPKQ